MSFYLERVIIYNNAPFENLQLDFLPTGINVLTGLNGRGKTTILSFVVDALIELSKQVFSNEYADKPNAYYRVSSSIYSLNPEKPSLVYVRFKKDDQNIDYVNIRGKIDSNEYLSIVKFDNPINFSEFASILENSGNAKYCKTSSQKTTEEIFNNFITPYFPSYRYEVPGYLNDVYAKHVDFSHKAGYSGYLPNKIEIISSLDNITNWIMDVVLDWMVTKQEQNIQFPDGRIIKLDLTAEKNIWDNLNQIVTELFREKSNGKFLRFGLGQRSNSGQRLSIVTNDSNKDVFAPNISVISSGEASIIGIFAEVIRQADRLHSNIPLMNIEGIVLIDEIDKHLHVKLQNQVLPKLMNLFPKLQFVITSHSPFLNMGLAEFSKKETRIFDLDNHGICTEPRKTVEFENFYNSIIADNENYAKLYDVLKEKTENLTKPLIFTEGKTDWKHFKKALSVFKSNNEFKDLDVEIFEYDFDNGDSKLHSYLETASKTPHRYKIIGIFDSDESNGKSISKLQDGIKDFGNNVYAMSIPKPTFRDNMAGISVEFLYTDDDLKRIDSDGRRLYTSDEFNSSGRLTSNPSIGVMNQKVLKEPHKCGTPKIIDSEVISISDESKALSKENFAKNILNDVFKDVSFEGFRGVFDRLKKILSKGKIN